MTLVPEGRRVFAGLTVEENLRLGRATGRGDRWSSRIADFFPVLGERRMQQAGTLSGGEQQQLAIARALLADPRVLLLDEPSLGLAPSVVDGIFRLIRLLKQEGLTIVLVEQNVDRSLRICDRAILLVSGRKQGEGAPDQLLAADTVHEAFFGERRPVS
jgi:branched-chain amino acid transport system ATP-binding protein